MIHKGALVSFFLFVASCGAMESFNSLKKKHKKKKKIDVESLCLDSNGKVSIDLLKDFYTNLLVQHSLMADIAGWVDTEKKMDLLDKKLEAIVGQGSERLEQSSDMVMLDCSLDSPLVVSAFLQYPSLFHWVTGFIGNAQAQAYREMVVENEKKDFIEKYKGSGDSSLQRCVQFFKVTDKLDSHRALNLDYQKKVIFLVTNLIKSDSIRKFSGQKTEQYLNYLKNAVGISLSGFGKTENSFSNSEYNDLLLKLELNLNTYMERQEGPISLYQAVRKKIDEEDNTIFFDSLKRDFNHTERLEIIKRSKAKKKSQKKTAETYKKNLEKFLDAHGDDTQKAPEFLDKKEECSLDHVSGFITEDDDTIIIDKDLISVCIFKTDKPHQLTLDFAQCHYTEWVEQWFKDPRAALTFQGYTDPENKKFTHPDHYNRVRAVHAFPREVDAFVNIWAVQEQIESRSVKGKYDVQLTLPCILRYGSKKEMGILRYIIDSANKQCYHRTFEPRTGKQLLSNNRQKGFFDVEFPPL